MDLMYFIIIQALQTFNKSLAVAEMATQCCTSQI